MKNKNTLFGQIQYIFKQNNPFLVARQRFTTKTSLRLARKKRKPRTIVRIDS